MRAIILFLLLGFINPCFAGVLQEGTSGIILTYGTEETYGPNTADDNSISVNDVYVTSGTNADTTYDNDGSNKILTKLASPEGNVTREMMIEFDLSGVSDTVVEASLGLYLEQNGSSGDSEGAEVYGLVDDFDETNTTWSCASDTNHDGSCEVEWTGTRGHGGTLLAEVAFTDASTESQYYEFTAANLIAAVESAKGGWFRIVVVCDTAMTGDPLGFTAVEGTDGQRPRLTLRVR